MNELRIIQTAFGYALYSDDRELDRLVYERALSDQEIIDLAGYGIRKFGVPVFVREITIWETLELIARKEARRG